ncbi:aminoglycoside phosphotransferase family protein [Kitasatospora sp. NBC_01266]|uniref:aminoglycoside phosphotransferase family protein n=1 Tax=Kitasatospora sp. NBC_01266 TaxID=2903572 RepID=UPI002E31BC49|nr:aminoglycoside phosphotransferase family protein [Kitasatospora sp. NBC_01266]
MTTAKLHADETLTSASLVRALLAAQLPQWAGLPLTPVDDSTGTSNTMYRLGEDLVVRLPRTPGAALDVPREHHWLPRLAARLPVAVPAPLGLGAPGEGYPFAWSVYRWLPGEPPTVGRIPAPDLLAADLADFLTALHGLDPTGAPPAWRAETLASRDAATRAAITKVHGLIDTHAATARWNTALRAPARTAAPVWIHADLQPGNVLLADGRLSAVIDFGCAGLGDPAVDLIAAWYLLPAEARTLFRTRAGADDATWLRAQGWTLSIALDELWYYLHTSPAKAELARVVIGELLADD